jgi:tetratricopeptide (TPR) repeat protein
MLLRVTTYTLLFSAAVAAQTTAPPAQPQQRDLKIEKIEDTTAPPKTPMIPRSYAVIIGISKYPKLAANLQLNYAERDAQSIYTALISPEGGNFKQENVHVLTGTKATLAAIRHEIDEWLPAQAKADDRVLIYFAGHGFLYGGKGYFAPSDFDPNQIAASGYPMDELGSVIGSKIQAKSKILFTDACHSGALQPADTAALNGKLAALQANLFSLTASRASERSFESPDFDGGHGVFTYYIVTGMEGAADTNHDGVVTADELSEYVHTQVRLQTKNEQNPTSDRTNFDPQMFISYVPANAAPANPPAPQFGQLVFVTNMDDTEVFVDGKSMGTVSKGKQINVPGLQPGNHTVQGVHMGYEPDGPRQEMVLPGQDSTVSIKIMIPRQRKKADLDLLNKGIQDYQKGYEENYKKAAESFEKALKDDPKFSQAAFYLGLTYNALFDETKAQQYFKQAIAIDQDYLEARADYAGMLLDIGDTDEAIRQINTVLTRQPDHAVALTMLAQADRLKGLWDQSIDAARKAIKISPKSAEPHMWMGDSLRLGADALKGTAATKQLTTAQQEYGQYLTLSDFDSKLAGQLNYWVLGSLIGFGKKKHAAQHDIWNDLRSLAYFGICDCDRKMSQYDLAIGYCQKALTYDNGDPYAHYVLGLSFFHKAVDSGNTASLDPALKHFEQVVAINPDLEEAKAAKQNIANIKSAMQ